MEVRFLYFDDCPNWRIADERLHQALAEIGEAQFAVAYQQITTPEQAEEAGFRGSPTILINDKDPFAQPDDPVGLSCRIYRSPAGTEPAPTLEQLRTVLRAAN